MKLSFIHLTNLTPKFFVVLFKPTELILLFIFEYSAYKGSQDKENWLFQQQWNASSSSSATSGIVHVVKTAEFICPIVLLCLEKSFPLSYAPPLAFF